MVLSMSSRIRTRGADMKIRTPVINLECVNHATAVAAVRSLLAGLIALPVLALASIDSVSPPSFPSGATDEFVTITGSGLSGYGSIMVRYDGPAGTFTLEPNTLVDNPNETTTLVAWVPIKVLAFAGIY